MQIRKPELDVPSGALLARLAFEVYSIDMLPDDTGKVLNQDINYKEYEVILLLFATLVRKSRFIFSVLPSSIRKLSQ
jgi:hypothetical protein